MSYKVKEIFYSLQGEGAQSGRAAVFCRFSGCNLWTGLDSDRKRAVCQFCDTDFWGTNGEHGGVFQTYKELVDEILFKWPKDNAQRTSRPLVILTGGEPGLQVDDLLVQRLRKVGFEVAIETNGTLELPPGIDWVCVSPKAGTKLKVIKGNEIKVVFPQEGLDPKPFASLDFDHFFLQPLDNLDYKSNLQQTVAYCLENPKWRLSLQIHKLIGIK